MKTPMFPHECDSLAALRAWAKDWNHLEDVPTQVCQLFEEWDAANRECEQLRAELERLKAEAS